MAPPAALRGEPWPALASLEGSRAGGDGRDDGGRLPGGGGRGAAGRKLRQQAGGRAMERRARAAAEGNEGRGGKRQRPGRREGGAGGRAPPIRRARPFFGVSQARRWGDAAALGRRRQQQPGAPRPLGPVPSAVPAPPLRGALLPPSPTRPRPAPWLGPPGLPPPGHAALPSRSRRKERARGRPAGR